jgi:hypothetical protein
MWGRHGYHWEGRGSTCVCEVLMLEWICVEGVVYVEGIAMKCWCYEVFVSLFIRKISCLSKPCLFSLVVVSVPLCWWRRGRRGTEPGGQSNKFLKQDWGSNRYIKIHIFLHKREKWREKAINKIKGWGEDIILSVKREKKKIEHIEM